MHSSKTTVKKRSLLKSEVLVLTVLLAQNLVAPNAEAMDRACKSIFTSTGHLQHTALLAFADKKIEQIKNRPANADPIDWQFNQPVVLQYPRMTVHPLNAKERARVESTTLRYFQKMGRNTVEGIVWTGFETGNTLTRHEDYRWNSLREQDFYNPETRKKATSSLRSVRVRNARFGMSNHEIDLSKPATWKDTDDMMRDMAKAGMRVSLDLHHFGIEDQFRVADANNRTIGDQSYYLHKDWPAYFAKFSREAVRRYHRSLSMITIMNEPETVVGFNGEMWHGGFPGWSHQQSNRYYIERSIQVGLASVLARIEIEDVLRKVPQAQRPLFMHTEAAVHKLYWDDFNLYRRFVVSDMILGHEWLVNADLKWLATAPIDDPNDPANSLVGRWHRLQPHQRTNFDWVIENYIVYAQDPKDREAMRQALVAKLTPLQEAHRKLERDFNKSMRDDTVMATDYYSHNEDKGADNNRLDPEPQHYAAQISAGNRAGLYRVLIDYYNRYKMPMMVGETGTPYFHYGARWHQQVFMHAADAAEDGVPFLGSVIYPAIDTWGWESAISVPRQHTLFNPSGMLRLAPEETDPVKRKEIELTPKPFIGRLVHEMGVSFEPETPKNPRGSNGNGR